MSAELRLNVQIVASIGDVQVSRSAVVDTHARPDPLKPFMFFNVDLGKLLESAFAALRQKHAERKPRGRKGGKS